MADFKKVKPVLQDKRVWAAALSAVVLIAGLVLWGMRSHNRSVALEGLNGFPPFENPAFDLSFPRTVVDNASARSVLEPGERRRIWTLHPIGGTPAALEVRLTNQGQRWFSLVNNQVIATFKAGSRQAIRILVLDDVFPRRHVRFRYRWTHLHDASAILGPMAPEIGVDYEGEALFLFEKDAWRLMHWTTPVYDQALDYFRGLEATPR
jgi:hypothetical protein